jgi:hypothetical protein
MKRKANTHSYLAVTPNFVGRFNFRLADLPCTPSSHFKIVASRSSFQRSSHARTSADGYKAFDLILTL